LKEILRVAIQSEEGGAIGKVPMSGGERIKFRVHYISGNKPGSKALSTTRGKVKRRDTVGGRRTWKRGR